MAYIILVADNPSELEVFERVASFFADRGHRTEVVNDGRQAWDRIHTDPPDILLTDFMLPHRDGLELIQELKKRHPDRRTGVILLGMVSAEVGSMLPLFEKGPSLVDMMVIKPFSGDRQRLAPFRPLNYHEQLIISVGHLLYRFGLEPPASDG